MTYGYNFIPVLHPCMSCHLAMVMGLCHQHTHVKSQLNYTYVTVITSVVRNHTTRCVSIIIPNLLYSKNSVNMSSTNVKVCDIEDDVKDELKKFRFRRNKSNAALILKVDRERQKICIDELLEDIKIDELQESLPGHQPRYIVYSYKMEHADGRLSYPMCFIYYTPRDSQIELQIMYAGTKLALQKEADLTRVYEVRELDELTEEWLKEKLNK